MEGFVIQARLPRNSPDLCHEPISVDLSGLADVRVLDSVLLEKSL